MNEINSEVYVDISIIVGMMPDEMKNKISKKFIEFIESNKSNNYNSSINPNIPLKRQELRQETKEMLGIIYRDYLCSNEERNKLIKEEKIQLERIENKKKQKYDSNNIFKKNWNLEAKEDSKTEHCKITKYKEPLIKRILKIIKSMCHIK